MKAKVYHRIVNVSMCLHILVLARETDRQKKKEEEDTVKPSLCITEHKNGLGYINENKCQSIIYR